MIRTRETLAKVDAIRVGIADAIAADAAKHGWSRKHLAAVTGLDPAEASLLLRGKLARFSIERLLIVLFVLGHTPVIHAN